jgi:hypothetical protein
MSGQAGSSGGIMPKNPLLATGGPRIMHLVFYINMACRLLQSALNYLKVISTTNNHSYLWVYYSVVFLSDSYQFFSANI